MELNITQLHKLNLVTIDGKEIENVTNYSIKGSRDGKTEITLTFVLNDVELSEFTALEHPGWQMQPHQ